MTRVPRVLVTGFEPFDGDELNPSWEVARALDGECIAGAVVAAARLPCVFATSLAALDAAIARQRPCIVLALGLAGSRSAISVERIADNALAQPIDEPVVAGGPPAYFTRLPAKAIVADLQDSGIAAELSFSAGSFVCNQVFYGLMHRLRRRPSVAAGFIHLPPLPQQAARYPGSAAMALDVIALLCAGTAEARVVGGRID